MKHSSVYWQIKRLEVDKDNDSPHKFDSMVKAIKVSESVPGYSQVLWTVSHMPYS